MKYLVAVLRFWKGFLTVATAAPGRWRQMVIVSTAGLAMLPMLLIAVVVVADALAPYILVGFGFVLLIRLYRKLWR